MAASSDTTRRPGRRPPAAVRDPLANAGALAAARSRPMSERLELALSWNAAAAELRAGVRSHTDPATSRQ